MTAIPITRQDARKVLAQIITVPFLFANGYMWYRFFFDGISEHADEVEGRSLLCFLICSEWGALTLMGSLGIMLQITRYMEKRWGFEDDGKEEEEEEGDIE